MTLRAQTKPKHQLNPSRFSVAILAQALHRRTFLISRYGFSTRLPHLLHVHCRTSKPPRTLSLRRSKPIFSPSSRAFSIVMVAFRLHVGHPVPPFTTFDTFAGHSVPHFLHLRVIRLRPPSISTGSTRPIELAAS